MKNLLLVLLFTATVFADKIQFRIIASDDSSARYLAEEEICRKIGQQIIVAHGERILPSKIEKLSMISKTSLYEGTYEYIFCAEVRDKKYSVSIFSNPVIKSMMPIINFLIFPGLVFTVFFSFIVGFIDRKVTARIQWRQGPPLLQNLYDFLKLLGKEIVIPETANKTLFILSPVIAFFVTILIATMEWLIILLSNHSFVGDIIVIIYLYMIPSIMFILAGSSSGNVIASFGVSREIKLLLSYELPLVTALVVPMIKSSSIQFAEIMNIPTAASISGIMSLIVVIMCFHAKLGLVPFDMPEAETELAGGIFIEYSGALLGLIKLTRQILFSIVPLFIITVYSFKGGWYLFGVKYLLLVVVFTLIRNTNPRIKIDQSIRFFWFLMFPLSLVAVILALLGK